MTGSKMPTCSRCGVMKATAEMRRSPKKGESGATLWMCKDRRPCATRRAELRIHEKARKRSQS
jgi:hypothetical protein